MRRTFEVWFYIGALLALYGVMLTAAGAYQWVHPPATVLAGLHSTFWAGALLLLVGGIYTIAYWPSAGTARPRDKEHRQKGEE